MTDKTVEAPKTREEILAMSLEAREAEVMNYQINIDNYAIAKPVGNVAGFEYLVPKPELDQGYAEI